MKRKKLKMPSVLEEGLWDLTLFEDGYISEYQFQDASIHETCELLRIDACIFKNIDFKHSIFTKCEFIDCIFDHCDLSNVDLSDNSFHRVEFKNCRCVGLDISNSMFQDTLFENIQGNYMNFSYSSYKQVEFIKNDFENASFNHVKFSDIEFKECNLKKCELIHTPLKNLDISTCDINDWLITIEDIKGLCIAPSQAEMITALLGVKIK